MLKRSALFIARILLLVLVALVFLVSPIYAANPTITTLAPTDITENSATLNGSITDFGTFAGPYVYLGFQYCTDDYFTISGGQYDKRTSEQSATISSGITTFSASITDLAYSSEYHYRAFLRYGTSYVYGVDTTFNSAMLSPDTIPGIITFLAFQDLLEVDDCLFVILADIPYSEIPGIPINRSYIWSLIDTGTEKGWNTGYAMNDNGYGYNVYSLYFTAADAITWGSTTKYHLQLAGNTSVFYGPVPVYDDSDNGDYLVSSDTWTVTSDYNALLASTIIGIAKILEQEWQVVLLDEQDTKTVLSSNGEKLFRNAISGIQNMAPSLFYIQNANSDTDVSERVWGTSLDQTYKERLLGADKVVGTADDTWIATAFNGVAKWGNIPFGLLLGLVCLGCCVFVIWKSNQRYATPMPGYVASLLIVICFGMLFLGLIVTALIGIALIVAASYLMFLRKA
jgi:hypothetical protein